MTTVLVTGPIGGGKTTVCRYLEASGYPVYDCDSRCKGLYENVSGLKLRIENELKVQFSELGVIFKDADLREKLEAIVYPLLLRDIENWKDSLDCSLAFIESAVALEKPLFRNTYDKVLLVKAPRRLRHSRNPKAASREALQKFDKSLIDYTIDNGSGLESLYAKIEKFLEQL